MEKPLVQSSIRIGREFLSRTHADYIPMTVLSTVLGGYFGSRLMSVIREEKGYTYDIHSVIYQMPLNSSFVITTETGNKYVENVIEDIYVEMDKLSSELIPNEELQQVKNYMLGNMCRNYEFGFGFSNRIMQLICSGIKLDDIITGAEIISDLTSNKLRDISRKYLSPNYMIECVVTNA
jgi:predicted Zn-dependent peptidase